MKLSYDERYELASIRAGCPPIKKMTPSGPSITYLLVIDPAANVFHDEELDWLKDSSVICRGFSNRGVKTIPVADLKWHHLLRYAVYLDFKDPSDELLYKLTWG